MGSQKVPPEITIKSRIYHLKTVFKHDFFAATLLYSVGRSDNNSPNAHQIVLKLPRRSHILGIPLAWLGQLLADHEYNILKTLQNLPGIPKLLPRPFHDAVAYEFIPGQTLDRADIIPDDFFVKLRQLTEKIHKRHVAYVDLNKRSNILITPQGEPALIDFQISCQLPGILSPLLNRLQQADLYHINKHNRRLRPDLMTPERIAQSRKVNPWIKLHRKVARPLTNLRRKVLAFLCRKGHLIVDEDTTSSPETDPQRWINRANKT